MYLSVQVEIEMQNKFKKVWNAACLLSWTDRIKDGSLRGSFVVGVA